jgi:hypothetical protein
MSLEIVPMTTSHDFATDMRVDKWNNQWCDLAVLSFNYHLEKAIDIKFIPSLTKILPYRGFEFGDLKLTAASGREYMMSEALAVEKYGKLPENDNDFYLKFDKCSVWITERWNDNERLGGVLTGQSEDAIMFDYKREIRAIEIRRQVSARMFYEETKQSVHKVLEWKKKNIGGERAASAMLLTTTNEIHSFPFRI